MSEGSGAGHGPGAVPIPPIDDLDRAFELPENILDERLRALYETLCVRMRRECSHLAGQTLTTLLIERIAFNYVVMRWKESQPMASNEGFAHATAQKEFNTFWLAMTQELNKLMRSSDRDYREALLRQVSSAMVRVLEDELDPATGARVRERLGAAFEEAGL